MFSYDASVFLREQFPRHEGSRVILRNPQHVALLQIHSSLVSPRQFNVYENVLDFSNRTSIGTIIFLTHYFTHAPQYRQSCTISGLRRGVNEIFALLGCYVAQTDSQLQTFRGNVSSPRVKQPVTAVSIPSSMVKRPRRKRP
jgi:hypothetical protein